MSRAQRLVFLGIAVAIAVGTVIALASGGGKTKTNSRAGTIPTATPQPGAATATATPRPEPPLVTGNGIVKLRFKQGDTVRFRVRANTTDEVHVHGYDLKQNVTPGKTVTFTFPAKITGIFEVEFEHATKQIAQLRVDP